MDLQLEDIVKNGTYYCPANKHYGFTGLVTCDRCQVQGLKVCIGYGQMDLCMRCVDIVAGNIRTINVQPMVPQRQHQFVTRMVQNMYRERDDDIVTLMSQNMFRKN
jgi:hypothetical protein